VYLRKQEAHFWYRGCEMSAGWTFLSHHAQVLLCIARDPDARLRQIATEVGITERSVQAIVNDLVVAGYLTRTRVGRRNHYEVHTDVPLRHKLQHDIDAGTLLRLVRAARRRRAGPVESREGAAA
jgi:hypothetical protein